MQTTWVLFAIIFFHAASSKSLDHRKVGKNLAKVEDVVFELYTRSNRNTPEILRLGDLPLLQASNYDSNQPVKMFAHGVEETPERSYPIKDEYLKKSEYNFIAVDWSILAAGDFLTVASDGIPAAGAALAEFIEFLVLNTGTSLQNIHLIGFSGGNGVVGIAGRTVGDKLGRKIARLTGLETSPPGLFLSEDYITLDDADFVDAIHTSNPTRDISRGHADFIINGGTAPQPGCEEDIDDLIHCSHLRSVELFSESINSQMGFLGRLCPTYEDYQAGLCNNATSALMGDPTLPSTRGNFHLTTNAESPFAQG